MRYPLVDGQGNFGSVEGDSPAAMRYTEARFSRIAVEMLRDIDANTVDWVPNYDETRREPTVLPSRVPNLMVNGSSGIAVGMATNIPPHNLGEVVDAIATLIDNPEASADDLMAHITGPDFPTGGVILGTAGIKEAYRTGRGRIRVRAKAHTEQLKGNRTAIIVTELPYQVNRAALIENIVDLVKTKKISEISDLRNESDRSGMRLVIELKRDAIAHGRAQQALQAHPDADHLRRHQHRPGRRRAAHAHAARDAQGLHRLPERGRDPAHQVRARQGRDSRPHPRRPAGRSRQPRPDHRDHPPRGRRRKRPRRPSWTPSSSPCRRPRRSSTCASRSSPASSATRSKRSTAVCSRASTSCASCSATKTPSTASSRTSCASSSACTTTTAAPRSCPTKATSTSKT